MVDVGMYLGYTSYLMRAQMHIKIDPIFKRRVQATAVLHGVTMQDFVTHALQFTMDAMREQGLEVADGQEAKHERKSEVGF